MQSEALQLSPLEGEVSSSSEQPSVTLSRERIAQGISVTRRAHALVPTGKVESEVAKRRCDYVDVWWAGKSVEVGRRVGCRVVPSGKKRGREDAECLGAAAKLFNSVLCWRLKAGKVLCAGKARCPGAATVAVEQKEGAI